MSSIHPIHPGPLPAYARLLLPAHARVAFVLQEDFDGDGLQETVTGYTLDEVSTLPRLYIMQIKNTLKNASILCIQKETVQAAALVADKIYTSVCTADTNGDQLPEVVVSLSSENDLLSTLVVIHWLNGRPHPVYITHKAFPRPRLNIRDTDGDGRDEILLEKRDPQCSGSTSLQYRWNGRSYQPV